MRSNTIAPLLNDDERQKFWTTHVSKNEYSGCWHWLGARSAKGYAIYQVPSRIGGAYCRDKVHNAHRLAYALWTGEQVPDGLFVLHGCDNPSCINPEHLFLGTHSDNMRDAVEKGRKTQKLSPAQVREIRKDPRTQRRIAEDYGVDHSVIGRVKRGDLHRGIPDEA